MLSNFKNRYLSPRSQQEQLPFLSSTESLDDASDTDYSEQTNDDVAQQHGDVAMSETVRIADCTCAFCSWRSVNDGDADPGRTSMRLCSRSESHRSLPSTRSIVQVLYPPAYLGISSSLPDPPSYPPSDSPPYPVRGDDAEISPLISSTTTSFEGTRSQLNPLAQDPSLTGVPSQRTPSSRAPPVESGPPIVVIGGDVSEETEPLPAYSRFDQRRPRFPPASDVLGPYPPLPVLHHAAR